MENIDKILEQRLSKLENDVATLHLYYAPISKVMEMLQPIRDGMTKIESAYENLNRRIQEVFDLYNENLRERSILEKQIGQDKIEQERRITDERIKILQQTSFTARLSIIGKIIAIVAGLLVIFSTLAAFFKYVVLSH